MEDDSLDELEQYLADRAELAELMQDERSFNHGRAKISDGANEEITEAWRPLDGAWDDDQEDWVPLRAEDAGFVSVKRYAVPAYSTTERHGTLYWYTRGCRCRPCKDAKAKYERERRRRV